jgi:hypothetical protein
MADDEGKIIKQEEDFTEQVDAALPTATSLREVKMADFDLASYLHRSISSLWQWCTLITDKMRRVAS